MSKAQVSQLVGRANALVQAGQLVQAENLARQVLAVQRKNPGALTVMGLIAQARGRYAEAADWHRKVIAVDGKNPLCHCNLGRTYVVRGQLTRALASFEKALKLRPGSPEAIAGKADVLERQGRSDRAEAVLEPFLKADKTTPEMASIRVKILQKKGDHQGLVDYARAQLDRPDLQGVPRRQILLLLGRSLERLGDYDGAFEAFGQGNAVDAQPFDCDQFARRVDDLIRVFAPEAISTLPHAEAGSDLPVFIASMPRAGSTLIEQIIHSHPQAHGAGELPHLAELARTLPETTGGDEPYPDCAAAAQPADLNRMARKYLDSIRQHNRRADRIADKSIANYFHIGLVTLLFPGARIIHVRRHPLDLCFSCYFSNLSPLTHPYTTDLRNLGHYYRQYMRLMEHWRSLPQVNMLEIDYEAVVADLEGMSRRIIEFMDLDWDEKCLRFHEAKRDVATLSYDQVNKPIYKSAVARYKRYDKHLGPLKEALGDRLPPEDA